MEALMVSVPEPRAMVPPGPFTAEKVWDLLARSRVAPDSVSKLLEAENEPLLPRTSVPPSMRVKPV